MITSIWENIFKKAQRRKSLAHILERNLLFNTLSLKELKFLEKIVHQRNYHEGEVVFKQGEIGVGMYIIAQGGVNITIHESGTHKPEKESLVVQLKENDFFGELSLVEDKGIRTATAIAEKNTCLVGFFKPDLLELLERNPSLGAKVVFRLAEVLGQRLKETSKSISHLKKEIKTLSRHDERKQKNENSS